MRPVRRLKASCPAAASRGLRTKNDNQKTGVEIVRKAVSYPARQIAINRWRGRLRHRRQDPGKASVQYGYGFDSQTGEFGNLVTWSIRSSSMRLFRLRR
jgi:chaperonin GroEL